jgi:Xaa-Pro dipeptidase
VQLRSSFEEHITLVCRDVEEALCLAKTAGASFDGIVFDAGKQVSYHADDQDIPFHPTPHFARFAPVAGPDHLLAFRPGQKPRLARVVPRDYWYETPAAPAHPYAEVLDVVEVATPEEARAALGDVARSAYVGSDPETAQALGLDARAVEPSALLAPLDWFRGVKTPYEVECIREASRIAARGHRAVREGMARGLTERQLHAAYLEAADLLDVESPYPNIIAWDDRSATLHYQTKRTTPPSPGAVLLVDAGAGCHGYASDVTRTYVRTGAHPVFAAALDRMDALQRDLVAAVGPGKSFVELHAAAHQGVAAILCDLGILKVKAGEAYERGLTRVFLPHGLGHHLGLQVHDVGGRQVSPAGERQDPPAHHPYLRTTRELAAGHVVTIEPGLYFIPMLLAPHRAQSDPGFDWKLVDALVPCGGIRVEDDVLVTATGHEDFTRSLVPGHRGV